MTRIFIDGYNFLWASDRHRPEALDNFEDTRGRIIDRLASHPRLAKHSVTIVFDAHKTDARELSTETVGGINVTFSRSGQTADEVLKQAANEFRNGAIIISSDQEVARHAEKKGCGVLGSHEFDRILNQPWDDEEEEDEYAEAPRKGPSHRASKARRLALARLKAI